MAKKQEDVDSIQEQITESRKLHNKLSSEYDLPNTTPARKKEIIQIWEKEEAKRNDLRDQLNN